MIPLDPIEMRSEWLRSPRPWITVIYLIHCHFCARALMISESLYHIISHLEKKSCMFDLRTKVLNYLSHDTSTAPPRQS